MMSFMKKIVKTSENKDGTTSGPLNKLRQTFTTGLQEISLTRDRTVPIKAGKTATSRLTDKERSLLRMVWETDDHIEEEPRKASVPRPAETVTRRIASGDSCRICRKSISSDEQSRKCDECGQYVCEDCASYSRDPNDTSQEWKCSYCRRRQGQDRLGLEPPPGSGMHRVPSVRRMAQKARMESLESSFSTLDAGSDLDTLQSSDGKMVVNTERCHLGIDVANEVVSKERLKVQRLHETEDNHMKQNSFRRKECGPSVERQKSIEIPKQEKKKVNVLATSKQYFSRPSSPDKHFRERYVSSETLSDRRSSSESTKDGNKPKLFAFQIVPRTTEPNGSYRMKHSSHTNLIQHFRISSASESSLEEHYIREEQERRRKSRHKRRSKFQRQKYNVEEPDSDPIYYREDYLPKADMITSLESSSALESLEKDLDDVSKRRHNLGVPKPIENPLRHIASETALYLRRFSSESSDVSDVSGDISTHSDRSSFSGIHKGYHNGGKLAVRHIRVKRKDIKHYRSTPFSNDGYFSPTGTVDSSPSPDDHSHLSTDKSCSVDDGDIFNASSQSIRSVPFVLVDSVVDHQRPFNRSLFTTGLCVKESPFPRRNSTGRTLPQLPEPENQLGLHPSSQGKTRSTHSLDLPREDTGWTERRASAPEGENIKIVIDDVDSDRNGTYTETSRKKILQSVRLHRDPNKPVRGFGIKVKGGKFSEDGHLHAYVSSTVLGGSAEKKGLNQGDRIHEWNGISLVDKTYEEVTAIIEQSSDVAELLFEKAAWNRNSSNQQESVACPRLKHATSSLILRTDHEIEALCQSTSPTRRKLPKTPNDLTHTSYIQGDIEVQIWFDQTQSNLVITLLSARGLRCRKSCSGKLPCAYAKLRLMPNSGFSAMKTHVAEPTTSPEWNKTFVFPSVSPEELFNKSLDITVWDQSLSGSKTFLGETQIPLRRADLQDCPEWYRLTLHQMAQAHQIMTNSNTTYDGKNYRVRGEENAVKSSPSNSAFLRRDTCYQVQRMSQDGGTSMILVPLCSDSKHINKKTSGLHSQDSLPVLYSSKPKITERTRSASFRIHRPSDSERDAEEQRNLGNLVKEKLSRTLSLRWDKDKRSVGLAPLPSVNVTTYYNRKNLESAQSSPDFTSENEVPEMKIGGNGTRRGPGQVFSKKIKPSSADTLGDIKLGFLMTKGQLEIQVICARELNLNPSGQPPDTYVKTYLKQGEKQMQKRKTRVVRHSSEPQYRQTLKYSALDIQGRRLLVMVWERQKGFEHNQLLGAVEIQLDQLDFSKLMFCWYPLYPTLHMDVESNEST
ncbi:uncharacterized protein LOC143228519 [Tachypleus tridentatus]|uniref:uncharacterized protein LOC143228519 n=1 Tax=Tachypleus tridentatus TaxID=6853 RepID=UPI003FD230DF